MRIRETGEVWMISSTKFGALVDGLRYAERDVIFRSPPVGGNLLQWIQLPNMKSTGEEGRPFRTWRVACADPLGF